MRILLHNVVAHPIAGVLWCLGYTIAGDRVHEWWSDSMEAPRTAPDASGLFHDKVHTDVGNSRVGRTARNKRAAPEAG